MSRSNNQLSSIQVPVGKALQIAGRIARDFRASDPNKMPLEFGWADQKRREALELKLPKEEGMTLLQALGGLIASTLGGGDGYLQGLQSAIGLRSKRRLEEWDFSRQNLASKADLLDRQGQRKLDAARYRAERESLRPYREEPSKEPGFPSGFNTTDSDDNDSSGRESFVWQPEIFTSHEDSPVAKVSGADPHGQQLPVQRQHDLSKRWLSPNLLNRVNAADMVLNPHSKQAGGLNPGAALMKAVQGLEFQEKQILHDLAVQRKRLYVETDSRVRNELYARLNVLDQARRANGFLQKKFRSRLPTVTMGSSRQRK